MAGTKGQLEGRQQTGRPGGGQLRPGGGGCPALQPTPHAPDGAKALGVHAVQPWYTPQVSALDLLHKHLMLVQALAQAAHALAVLAQATALPPCTSVTVLAACCAHLSLLQATQATEQDPCG